MQCNYGGYPQVMYLSFFKNVSKVSKTCRVCLTMKKDLHFCVEGRGVFLNVHVKWMSPKISFSEDSFMRKNSKINYRKSITDNTVRLLGGHLL